MDDNKKTHIKYVAHYGTLLWYTHLQQEKENTIQKLQFERKSYYLLKHCGKKRENIS